MTHELDSSRAILQLAAHALGDLAVYEREGGDMVGTDAYPRLRDAWPRLVELLRHGDPEVRGAAGYALAFVLEPAAQTLPALDRAAAAEPDEVVRATLLIAAGRLRASVL